MPVDRQWLRYLDRHYLAAGVGQLRDQAARRSALRTGVLVAALAGVLALAGCNLFGGDGSSTTSALSRLSWCDGAKINFQDNSSASQTWITNWSDVKDQLGFTPYLPSTLPKGSCLNHAGGSIHDPIYGGRFQIAYQVNGKDALAFSEAPKKGTLSDKVQCAQSAQDASTNICLGVINGTAITLASKQSTSYLQNLFAQLKPNVDWVPASSSK